MLSYVLATIGGTQQHAQVWGGTGSTYRCRWHPRKRRRRTWWLSFFGGCGERELRVLEERGDGEEGGDGEDAPKKLPFGEG